MTDDELRERRAWYERKLVEPIGPGFGVGVVAGAAMWTTMLLLWWWLA